MGHGPARTDIDPHDLLSATHGDTSAAAAVAGDVIVALRDTSGLVDDAKFWLDGAVLGGLSGANGAGAQQFWLDGAPLDVLLTPTVSGATTWRRLAAGTNGQALVMTAGVPAWQDVAGLSTGDAARVYRATNLSCAYNTLLAVDLSTAEYDDAGYWASAAPSGFTVPTAGVYVVTGQLTWDNAQVGLGYAYIYVDGVQKAAQQNGINNVDPAYGDYDPQQVTAVLKLSAGAFVALRVRAVRLPSASANMVGGQNRVWFSIVKVG